jgi:hypothetical protein
VIVGPEELLHILELHGADVVRRTDGHPAVWMVGGIQGGGQRHHDHAIRTILVTLSPLVEHHLPLRLEALARECRQQKSHAIGFHPQRAIDRARRDDFPVVGAVGVRGTVEERTGLLQRREVASVVVLRALEHQMLEQMCKAGASRTLVLRAHVIPHVDRHDWHVAILVHDHVEPVGKRALGKGKGDIVWSNSRSHFARSSQFVFSFAVRFPHLRSEFGVRLNLNTNREVRREKGERLISYVTQMTLFYRTGISGILPLFASAVLCAAIETCAAVRSATVRNDRAAAEPGSPITSGTPVSPPSRIG